MEVRFESGPSNPSDGPLLRQAMLSKGPASQLSRHSNTFGDPVQGDRRVDASGGRKSKVKADILRVACRTASIPLTFFIKVISPFCSRRIAAPSAAGADRRMNATRRLPSEQPPQ